MANKKKSAVLREVKLKYTFRKIKSEVIGSQATDPAGVVRLFSDLQNETKEKLIAVNLDARSKILCFEVVAIGSVSAIHLRPMEVFRTSILVNASGLIVIHNHPSGDPKPDKEDIAFTEKLERIAADLGLALVDHIIVGHQRFYSFASDGTFGLED